MTLTEVKASYQVIIGELFEVLFYRVRPVSGDPPTEEELGSHGLHHGDIVGGKLGQHARRTNELQI